MQANTCISVRIFVQQALMRVQLLWYVCCSMSGNRRASLQRETGETYVSIDLAIDGSGSSSIQTGIPFFDHMLTLFSKHSLFDLQIDVRGDLQVDFHHSVEDTGIVLGKCLAKALGDKTGIRRYGWAVLPMDETLVR